LQNIISKLKIESTWASNIIHCECFGQTLDRIRTSSIAGQPRLAMDGRDDKRQHAIQIGYMNNTRKMTAATAPAVESAARVSGSPTIPLLNNFFHARVQARGCRHKLVAASTSIMATVTDLRMPPKDIVPGVRRLPVTYN